MPNGTIAVIKETDNHRAQPDLDTLGGVTVAAGTDGQEGALADKFMESLHLCRDPVKMSFLGGLVVIWRTRIPSLLSIYAFSVTACDPRSSRGSREQAALDCASLRDAVTATRPAPRRPPGKSSRDSPAVAVTR